MQLTTSAGIKCIKTGVISSGVTDNTVIDLGVSLDHEVDTIQIICPTLYASGSMQWIVEPGGMHIYACGAAALISRFQFRVWRWEKLLAAPIIRGRAGPYYMTTTPTNYDITLPSPVPNDNKAAGQWAHHGSYFWVQPSVGNATRYCEINHPFPDINTMQFVGNVSAAFGNIYLCYEVLPLRHSVV
jgi:hypothetical protein